MEEDSLSQNRRRVLRVAQLGAGIFASSAHFSALSKLCAQGCVKVTDVWSRTLTSSKRLSERFEENVSAHSGDHELETLLDREDIDAMVIALPISVQPPLIKRALAKGIHVLSEKPLAECVSSARELLNVSQSCTGVVHCVAENVRCEGAMKALEKARVDIGGFHVISMTACAPLPIGGKYATDWRLNADYAGGQLLDSGVHHIAALRVAAGCDIRRVSARGSCASEHLPWPDCMTAWLQFENGVCASYCVSYAGCEFAWELRAIAARGDVIVRRKKGVAGYTVMRRIDGCVEEEFVKFSGIDGEFRAFVESCRKGVADARICAAMAFNDVATIEALLQAAKSDTVVDVAKIGNEEVSAS